MVYYIKIIERRVFMEAKKSTDIKMLSLSALFTALIAVGAYIKIPVPLWPFTLQTLFTTMAGLMLGPRYGTLSCAAYMILGLIGLPVFTGGGGPQYIFNPTFGCIVGFTIGAFVAGSITKNLQKHSLKIYFMAGLADIAVVYIIGMAWFWLIKTFYMNDPIGIWTLFVTCFMPTIGVDVIKAIAAAVLTLRISPLLQTNL